MRASVRFAGLVLPLVVVALAGPAAADEPVAATPADEAKRTPMGWTGILGEEKFKSLHVLSKDPAPPLHGGTIDLAGGKAYLSLPAGTGPFPALVVIQEWYGLNDHIRHWTDRLAADGYAALAVDLYDGTVATTSDAAMAAMKSVDESRAHEILAAARDYLRTDGRILAPTLGTIGWCFGGGWSLNCALAWPDLDACVIYYGRLVDDPEQVGKIGAAVCGVFGNRDEGIPPASVDAFAKALEAAGISHEIHRYDADHAFANPSGARYDQENASAAWEEVRVFLARELKTR